MDDGSTDDTSAIAQRFERITYLHQTNRGPAAARNRGLRQASTPLVSFLDADDEWAPGHPETALAFMREWEIVIGRTQCLTRANATEEFIDHAAPFHTLNVGSALFRREIFDRVGEFNEALSFGEDLDWFLRAREKGMRMALIEPTTLRYRLHDRNLIGQSGAATGGMLNALHLSISRRREDRELLAEIPSIK